MIRMTWLVLIVALLGQQVLAEEYQCTDPQAAPAGQEITYYEGFYFGANGCLYDPAYIDVNDVPPWVGPSGDSGARLFFVNGANPIIQREAGKLDLLAQRADLPVVGVFNTTSGEPFDLIGQFPTVGGAAERLAKVGLERLERGEDFHVRGGSDGTRVMRDGLQLLYEAALARSRSETEAQAWMGQLVRAESHGSVVKIWPDGPAYVHYVNVQDPVPSLAGVSAVGSHPGVRSVIALFSDRAVPFEAEVRELSPISEFHLEAHGFRIYNLYREPFESLYDKRRAFLKVTPVWLPRRDDIPRPAR